MRHSDAIAALKTSAVPAPLSRSQKLQSAAAMLNSMGDRQILKTVPWIEWTPALLLDIRSGRGTVLEPIAAHLNRIGIPTKNTLGGVMRSLELTQAELHNFACWCHTHGDEWTAPLFGGLLSKLALEAQ